MALWTRLLIASYRHPVLYLAGLARYQLVNLARAEVL